MTRLPGYENVTECVDQKNKLTAVEIKQANKCCGLKKIEKDELKIGVATAHTAGPTTNRTFSRFGKSQFETIDKASMLPGAGIGVRAGEF